VQQFALIALALVLNAGCNSCAAEIGDRTDTGPQAADSAPTPTDSCKKIDLVFSVDPSGSMDEELESMATVVFPAFAEALLGVGDDLQDFRVGVIDACPNPADFHTRGESNSSCGYQSQNVWMDSASTTLEQEFACAGDLYRINQCSGDNDDEQPLRAAIASLTPPYSTGQNTGFLREDALLVVVAITDEDECADAPDCADKSAARAQAFFDELSALKGDPKKMVLLGIGGGLPDGCTAGSYGAADPATLLHAVTQLFVAEQRGVWWDLCQGQLEDGLTEAIGVIDQACYDFPQID
jgi:hypothetical protein